MKVLKTLGWLIAVVALVKYFIFPDYVHRFRLTIEFDTPDGVKSASGVHEVVRANPVIGHFQYGFRGEAIFLDLGRGKHVIALLAHGRPSDGRTGVHTGSMTFLGVEAYATRRLLPWEYWVPTVPFAGIRELQPDRVPTMVTFSNLQDPQTVRVIDPFDSRLIEEGIDAGFAFRSATIEGVPIGIWPLNAYGMTGYTISTGIDDRLPWLQKMPRSATSNSNRFTIQRQYFRRVR